MGQPTLFICIHPLKYVGNGLCAVPLRGDYNPCGQTGITHRLCHSETAVSRGILPSCWFYLVVVLHPTWWISALALLGRNDKRYNVPPLCHSERTVVSRGIFPSGKFCLVVLSHPTWWIPPLALLGRNDTMGGRFYGFALCFLNVSGSTAPSSVSAAPSQLPRRGSFCTVVSGVGFYR